MEKITIRNFGGLKEVEVEIKSINVLIGPQGAGKSITVKLLYFFKSFLTEMIQPNYLGESEKEKDTKYKEKFLTFFPRESWPVGKFEIVYELNEIEISIARESKQLIIKKSRLLKSIIRNVEKEDREDGLSRLLSLQFGWGSVRNEMGLNFTLNSYDMHYFIPAGRSFFATIQKNIFLLLGNKQRIDPFLTQFGALYEDIKGISFLSAETKKDDNPFTTLITQILNSRYHREKDEDFLIHEDSRKVNIANASSGQQETLPLMLMLQALNQPEWGLGDVTIYIEEPEAHLFPEAQKRIIQLLARTFNREGSNVQIIVTTHSPYILSSLNNLMYAGKLAEMADKKEQVNQVIPQAEQISPDLVCAYALDRGQLNSLIDEESKLISQNSLDAVSDEISIEFGKLLDIEFFDYG